MFGFYFLCVLSSIQLINMGITIEKMGTYHYKQYKPSDFVFSLIMTCLTMYSVFSLAQLF